ncbi:MAG: amino acid transporter, partial [Halanaeroarchaeum sp.]
STVIPLVGTVGAIATVLALLWHLYSAEPDVFGTVVIIAVAVLGVELLYFEREHIERDLKELEETV